MAIHNANLNIHYTMPDELFYKLVKLYKEMPGWKGIHEGIPSWFCEEEKYIQVSVEPSGLQFYAEMPEEEWSEWFDTFKKKASRVVGYEVGEIEDGFTFVIYD